MKVLSKEKIRLLAEKNGWSLAYAEGFIDGEAFRRRGKTLSAYAQIGIDEYCLGLRASYYEQQIIERQHITQMASVSGQPTARSSLKV
ncbi:MAG: hypothetical protein HY067_14675 [Betaproteobacteria bacterium]|nr:hypothetical protein [Betaproteobacteria bacterium]